MYYFDLMFSDEYFMKVALQEAQIAFNKGEIPVGAVIVCNDTIIAKAHNQTEQLNDFTAHAEMIAITSASNYLSNKYLRNCTLYVTLEPCSMCAGASSWSQVGKIVFGASDPKKGFSIYQPVIINNKINVVSGVLKTESLALLQRFFKSKR